MNKKLDKIFKLQLLYFPLPLILAFPIIIYYFWYKDFSNMSYLYFYGILILSIGMFQRIFGNIDRALKSGTTRKTFLKSSVINLFIA